MIRGIEPGRHLAGALLCLCALASSAQEQAQDDARIQAQNEAMLSDAIDQQATELENSAAVQQRINALDDETREMLNEYRQAMSQLDDLNAYNTQLEGLVATQQVELADYERQFNDIEVTKRRILPLIVRMVEVLKEFVSIDVPFLTQERNLRIEELEKLLERPDVPTSEKYRRVAEAYQIELEYGHNIEAYEAEIEVDGETRTVAFLRYGRLGLYYMTLDGLEAGYWDADIDRWVKLDDEFRPSMDRAIRIARKQLPPDLTRLVVTAPEDRT